jgi:hypothetical protein
MGIPPFDLAGFAGIPLEFSRGYRQGKGGGTVRGAGKAGKRSDYGELV